jgi:hypothetical protein
MVDAQLVMPCLGPVDCHLPDVVAPVLASVNGNCLGVSPAQWTRNCVVAFPFPVTQSQHAYSAAEIKAGREAALKRMLATPHKRLKPRRHQPKRSRGKG